MLIITRKINEAIIIDKEITVEILSIDRRTNTIKLGIIAPKNIQVDRMEIHRIKESKNVPNKTLENSLRN